ncbi:MAG: hypothetical protein COB35_01195 [Gammaproteobacteria bacterium]|nr:MAG: hypothetical protein COB35_01195 [Gammaproteobacteria bacterium]
MINIQHFKELQKKSSHSYHQQKALIKKVLLGKTVYCDVCKGLLSLKLSENSSTASIYCAKGCTSIQLEVDG